MTTFGDTMKNATTNGLLGAIETTVTYTPRNEAGVEVSARLGPVRTNEEFKEVGEETLYTRTCRISTDDVANPHGDATVTIGDETWAVTEISDESDFAATLELLKSEQGARHGESFYTGGEG